MRIFNNSKLEVLLFFIFFSFVSFAQNSVTVGDVDKGEIDIKVFKLNADSEVKISGEIAEFDDNSSLTFYGWILDANTRKVVWHSADEDFDDYDELSKGVIKFTKTLTLPKGTYEVYYTGITQTWRINGFGDFLRAIFGGKDKYRRRYRRDLGITVNGNITRISLKKHIDEISKNFVEGIIQAGDHEYYKKRFSVKKDTRIKIYAVGEGERKTFYDYGWIYDLKNHRKIWKMERANVDRAGGAKKNIMVDEDFILPAGNYELVYVTDDSHSYEEWNSLPPDDPLMYGIQIMPLNKNDLNNFEDYIDNDEFNPIVELTKIGSDRIKSIGLKVKKDTEIKILCIGEQGYYRDMVDYGWIIDAETKEIVWEMKKNETEHAGGAEKNRMIDDQFLIEKGDYIVYYSTDDSHAYHDWNDSKPYEPDRWGITIWTVNEKDKTNLETFDPEDYKSENIICEIVRVRDNKHITKTFTLKKDSNIRIFALGEGSGRYLSDYGWIDNAKTGRNVWEMTYRKTEHAGGAKKNRMFNGVIFLKAGRYKLTYETDGSHSYRDWNDTPPRNPERYGITLMYEK